MPEELAGTVAHLLRKATLLVRIGLTTHTVGRVQRSPGKERAQVWSGVSGVP